MGQLKMVFMAKKDEVAPLPTTEELNEARAINVDAKTSRGY